MEKTWCGCGEFQNNIVPTIYIVCIPLYSDVDALRRWKRKNAMEKKNAMESWTAILALFMLMAKSLMINNLGYCL